MDCKLTGRNEPEQEGQEPGYYNFEALCNT